MPTFQPHKYPLPDGYKVIRKAAASSHRCGWAFVAPYGFESRCYLMRKDLALWAWRHLRGGHRFGYSETRRATRKRTLQRLREERQRRYAETLIRLRKLSATLAETSARGDSADASNIPVQIHG